RSELLKEYEDGPVAIIKTLTSADGTEKYLFSLADGNVIEGVFMKYKYGNTQCVSTQVGCRMGCKFCASTLGGLARNLTSGEILCQVLAVNAAHGGDGKARAVTNVVLMGSGEPLDNYDNTVKFLKNVSAEGGINISPRNISLSTCGIVPKIYSLADEGLPVNLTISLHQTTDEGRARTMPIAKKYTIAEILKACEYYFEKTGRRYIFEYSLIDGENCEKADAERLIALLKGRPCHVNLIRLNEVKERSLKAATDKKAYAFAAMLEKGGLSATVRRSMGSDIGGACGQLRASFIDKQ
ncbi:MAG TPA: 23S rRNA (adenine(2503)-C(2))-methyltransferase RlmN, partial [Clostridiales bacterium]|nr:23S rRNA (adenine(2503)-C(2))-methyltransferase RlmN [Clostridiales bacterium]